MLTRTSFLTCVFFLYNFYYIRIMVNTEPNRDSMNNMLSQLKVETIDIDNDVFIKREIVYCYGEDQFFFDLMDIEDTFYEQFSFRIGEKQNNLQLSFYPNYTIYIYNKQYGLEDDEEEDDDEDNTEEIEENFDGMEIL